MHQGIQLTRADNVPKRVVGRARVSLVEGSVMGLISARIMGLLLYQARQHKEERAVLQDR